MVLWRVDARPAILPPMFWSKKEMPHHTPTPADVEVDPRLREALSTVLDPDLGQDLVTLGFVRGARVEGGEAQLSLELTTPACPHRDAIGTAAASAVDRALPGLKTAIRWSAAVTYGRHGGGMGQQSPMPSLDKVRNIVLVASGKGGVGKSTVATNLACALARTGARTGLLDADIYGPSIPTMFGLHDGVASNDGKTIEPHEVAGLRVMSMGFLIEPERAMIWRGPMLNSAVVQFLRDVHWGELDYLVVDLPPGTGDVQLTFAQQVKVTGAVIVSTPQEVALVDVIRAKAMFDQVQIPVLGVVENMSWFRCDGCDKKHFIFAHGGARKVAMTRGLDVLAELPLDVETRAAGDAGLPIVAAAPDSDAAGQFMALARAVASRIAVLNHKNPTRPEPGPSDAGRRRLSVVS